jgi:hypothetical protein
MKRKRNRGGVKGKGIAKASAVKLAALPWEPNPEWDHGATGPANKAQLMTEERGEMDVKTGKLRNPNRVTGARRLSVAQLYERKGLLTVRQLSAAHRLLLAWEQKDRSPAAIQEAKVDHSPKPDDRTAMLVDRQMEYIKIGRHVPQQFAAFVNWVARDDRHITSMPGYRRSVYMDRLRKGLDMMADSLGM